MRDELEKFALFERLVVKTFYIKLFRKHFCSLCERLHKKTFNEEEKLSLQTNYEILKFNFSFVKLRKI